MRCHLHQCLRLLIEGTRKDGAAEDMMTKRVIQGWKDGRSREGEMKGRREGREGGTGKPDLQHSERVAVKTPLGD